MQEVIFILIYSCYTQLCNNDHGVICIFMRSHVKSVVYHVPKKYNVSQH